MLEPAWARLQAGLPGTASLDEIITLHEQALGEIATGMFLAEPAAQLGGAPVPSAIGGAGGSSGGSGGTGSGGSGGGAGGRPGSASGGREEGGAANVVGALRAVLRAMGDLAGPVRRLAGVVEQAAVEQALYVQRVSESEETGAWNDQVGQVPGAEVALLLLLLLLAHRAHAGGPLWHPSSL